TGRGARRSPAWPRPDAGRRAPPGIRSQPPHRDDGGPGRRDRRLLREATTTLHRTMRGACVSRAGVAIAARALADLAARLDRPVPPVARVGADLWMRPAHGLPWPDPAPLLRAANGRVHPRHDNAWHSI